MRADSSINAAFATLQQIGCAASVERKNLQEDEV
jgi:hypothetical protein